MAKTIPVRNPRTGLADYEIAVTDEEQITATSRRMRAAQVQWENRGLDARICTLQEFKRALQDNGTDIVTALSVDTGRNLLARQELDGLLRSIDRWCTLVADMTPTAERNSSVLPHIAIQKRRKAYPLVGIISPWNFPLLLSFIDTTPALLAGCAALIKPSEVTPRFADPLSAAIGQVPELRDILHIITGDGSTGAALVDQVDAVAFTGSVSTGRKVAAAAAAAFIPAFLELGGKDPVIVLEGSDLKRAVTAILRASVAATGQACQSLERIYVHRNSHDEFVAMLTGSARKIRLSYPDPNSGTIGPLIFAAQADKIAEHLADAKSHGAIIHCGGKIESCGGGFWIRPTVLSNVSHAMKIMREETFGPIMPVMAFETPAEAIGLANDSEFGLSAAVFGPNEPAALEVAEQLQAGGISVNDAGMTTMIFEEEKSGFGLSGMGPSRMGASGFLRFSRSQALYLNRGDTMSIDFLAEQQN